MSAQHTRGHWRAVPQGGYSTVLCATRPGRNDTRIPAYGYREGGEHSLGYPFIEDDGRVRWDFVCFSHEDARLIAAAPELVEALADLLKASAPQNSMRPGFVYLADAQEAARAAIAKACGQ